MTPSEKPSWIRAPAPQGQKVESLRRLARKNRLHTVCESALCPNIGDCWARGHATFLILGPGCTRNCRFCSVPKGPSPVDEEEPERLARAMTDLSLDHAVITSVTRDDLADGGADAFAQTIRSCRRHNPGMGIEVLVPDFSGNTQALATVLAAKPDILAHNIETVQRLYPKVRKGAGYRWSLDLLGSAGALDTDIPTKSGLMLGLGETWDEVIACLYELRENGVAILSLGQYLRPGKNQVPVDRYYHPGEFIELESIARSLGFSRIAAGPLIRSSYRAPED